jgi:hypothetical protein
MKLIAKLSLDQDAREVVQIKRADQQNESQDMQFSSLSKYGKLHINLLTEIMQPFFLLPEVMSPSEIHD